jgi:HK97 family phage major capsid protein
MNSLTRLIDERAAISRLKAGKAASEARTHSGSVAHQARAETALTDLQHYLTLQTMIRQQQNNVYHQHGSRSFFSDFLNQRADKDARSRLEEQRAMSDYGGLVVPQYLSDLLASSGHSARPLCDLLTQPLGNLGGSVTLTRVTTGSTASMQATEGAALTVDDPASTELTVPVRTVFSMASLDMQLLERSDKAGLDRLISREILGAVLAQQESQLINGSGSSGEVTGLLQTASAGSITLTNTTAYDLLDSVARAAQASHEATGNHPDTVILAPRRWMWLLANAGDRSAALSVDTSSSPIAGKCMGLDVIASASMPLTLSTNQDRVIVARRDDLFMGETPPTVETFQDYSGGAQSLASRVRVVRYMAFGAIRPTGVQIISGSALANPYT